MVKTRRRRNVHRRRTKKLRRRHQTKRRVKRRRKRSTRKKRGRGISPSKLGVGVLAATASIHKALGHGISPDKGTAAAVKHFREVPCNQFHISDVIEHSEDHGRSTGHYRPVLEAALEKKRGCKRDNKPMRKQRESAKKARIRERAEKRAAKAAEQERIERERTNPSPNTGSQGVSSAEKAAYGAAAAAAGIGIAEYMRRNRRPQIQRDVVRREGGDFGRPPLHALPPPSLPGPAGLVRRQLAPRAPSSLDLRAAIQRRLDT